MLGDVLPLVRNGAFERLGAMRVALLVARPRTSLTPRGAPWPHAPGPPLDSEEATRREVLAAAEAVAGQLARRRLTMGAIWEGKGGSTTRPTLARGRSVHCRHIYNEVEAMHTRMMRSLLAPSAEGSGSARLYVGAEAISASERADLAAHMGGSAFRPATASALLTYVREHSAPADPAGAMCAVWRAHTAIVTLRARAFLLEALSALGVARGVEEISQRLRTDLQGYEEALQQVQIDMPPGGAGALPNRYAFNLVQVPPFVHTHDEGRHRLTAALPLPIRINHTAWGVGVGPDPKCDRNEAPLTFDPFRAWLFPGMSADFFPSSCLCCAPRPVAPSLQTQFSWGCARA